jgi:hypothetical protein
LTWVALESLGRLGRTPQKPHRIFAALRTKKGVIYLMNIAENVERRKHKRLPILVASLKRDEFPGTRHETLMEFEGFDPHWGLPDRLREAAIERDLLTSARLYDALSMLGFQPQDQITAYGVLDVLGGAKININKNDVYEAFASPIFFVPLRQETRGRGRPMRWYRLATPNEIMRRLVIDDVDDATSPLTEQDLASPAAYRAGLQRGMQQRQPEISRAALARRLGVSKATTRNYDRRNGTRIEARFVCIDMSVYENWTDVFRLYESKRDRRYCLKIYPWNGHPPYLAPLKMVVAATHIKAGSRVEIVEQTTNGYALHPRHTRLYALPTEFVMI